LPVLARDLREHAEARAARRVVRGAVQRAERALRRLHQRRDLGLVRDVGADEDRAAARRLDPAHRLRAAALVDVRHRDARTLAREGEGRRAPDPGAGARDETDLAGEQAQATTLHWEGASISVRALVAPVGPQDPARRQRAELALGPAALLLA